MIIFRIVLVLFFVSVLVSAVPGAAGTPSLPPPPAAPAQRDIVVIPGAFPAAAVMALAHHVGDTAGRITLSLKASDTGIRTSILTLSTRRASVEIGRLRRGVNLLQEYLPAVGATGATDLPRVSARELDTAGCAWTAAYGYPDEIIAAVNDTDLVSIWRLTTAAREEGECLRLAENFRGPSRRFSPPPSIYENTDASIQYDFSTSLAMFLPMISRILEDSWIVERLGKADILWFGVNSTGMEMRWTGFASRYVVFRLVVQSGASVRNYSEVSATRINMVTDLGKNSVSAIIESNVPLNLDEKSLREWLSTLPSPLPAITAISTTAPLPPSR